MAIFDLKRVINLEKLAVRNPAISYESELQPFAVFSFEKKTRLLFSTGKILVHRGKTVSDMKRSVKKLINDILIKI